MPDIEYKITVPIEMEARLDSTRASCEELVESLGGSIEYLHVDPMEEGDDDLTGPQS
jgi:hypothetical protein